MCIFLRGRKKKASKQKSASESPNRLQGLEYFGDNLMLESNGMYHEVHTHTNTHTLSLHCTCHIRENPSSINLTATLAPLSQSNIRIFNISTGEKTREKKNTRQVGSFRASLVDQLVRSTNFSVCVCVLCRTDFGEGITAFQNTLYQELWRTNRVILYDQSTFAKVCIQRLDTLPVVSIENAGVSASSLTRGPQMSERNSPMTDGWGITNDGEQLIGSDSTSFLYFMDSELALKRKLQVTYLGEPVVWLNELEYIYGQVWANIWQRDCIARIDPATGEVKSWVVLSELHR